MTDTGKAQQRKDVIADHEKAQDDLANQIVKIERIANTLVFYVRGGDMPGSLKKTLETVLVVDDNKEVLKIVVRVLEDAHFHVLTAGNGAEALRVASETDEKIHLVLSDVDMPQMSGPHLGQLLRKPDRTCT
jgi:PleD family two-component response regulator